MNGADRIGEGASCILYASCRDKGRSRVDEGALCLSWWG